MGFLNFLKKTNATMTMGFGGQRLVPIFTLLNKDYFKDRFTNEDSVLLATAAVFLWPAVESGKLVPAQLFLALGQSKAGVCKLGTFAVHHENLDWTQVNASDENFFLSFAVQLLAYQFCFTDNSGFKGDEEIVLGVVAHKKTILEGINYAKVGLKFNIRQHDASLREDVSAAHTLLESNSAVHIRSQIGIRDRDYGD